jgi:DNA-binding FadR family transcriptional regulator
VVVQDLPARSDLPTGQTLHASIVHHMASAILTGDIPSDSLLPKEGDLAEQFGVSRSVVRDAMKILAAKGLVESRRRRGTVVLSSEHWNFFDAELLSWWPTHSLGDLMSGSLMELRRAFEPVAAELAALRRNQADIAELQRAYSGMSSAETAAEFSVADLEYHRVIFRTARNPMFVQIGRLLDPLLKMFLETDDAPNGNLGMTGLALHGAVLDAIQDGDPALANRSMLNLICWTELLLKRRKHVALNKRVRD